MSKIEETMNTLHDLIENAQRASEENKAVSTLHTLAAKFVAGCSEVFTAEGFDENKVQGVVDDLKSAFFSADKVATALKVASGSDREAGDKAARALTMAVDANWLEGDEADKATALVGQWNATAPKGRSKGTGTGSSNAPSLPFPVSVKCEADGWSATQNTSLNSVRWAAILHHADKHGSKPSKGTPIHQGLTEALESVIGGKSHSAQGGGYIVDKASA